jgi:uncharacterized protein YigE (DUF2233 family)
LREGSLSFWRPLRAFPSIATPPWPTLERAIQCNMSARRTLSATLIFVGTRSGSTGIGQTGVPTRISPLCRAIWKTEQGGCCSLPTPECSTQSSAVGLYVERGRELVHANTKSGTGNFHMKPNGIFYISGGSAAVAETQAFLKQRPRADLATQSGPMLVTDGRLHPRFKRGSTSLKLRTGVGVRTDGKVIFAISQEPVSFESFARLFRDGQKCPNALFLDGGSASSFYAPTLNRFSNVLPIGPMLAVFETNRDAPRQ